MSLKLRKGLITFLTAFVLLFASLAIFVAPSNPVNVNAEVIAVQLEGVEDYYIVNAKETFPASLEEPVSAEEGVIIYPNGKVYEIVEDKEYVLSAIGEYTLRYFGENQIVEKNFNVTQKHFVLSTDEVEGKNEIVCVTEEMMEGQLLPNGENFTNKSDWPNISQNLTTFGREALIVRMEAGTVFNYSVPIDLSAAGEDGLTDIITFQPRYSDYDKSKPHSGGNYKIGDGVSRNIVITLTDCYDSSRYMKFIVQEGGDTNYARAGTDNLLDTGWVFPASKQATSDMSVREFYEGTQYGYAYLGKYGAGSVTGYTNEWIRRDAYHLKFDYENAKVWVASYDTSGVKDYKAKMVTDFMNKSVYPTTDYRGFTTGEVYLSIEFTDYQVPEASRVDIYEIAGKNVTDLFGMREIDQTGDASSMLVDTKSPLLNIDFVPTVSDGVFVDVGSYFTVPSVTAYDVNLKGEVSIMAYRNYEDVAHRINVPIENGKMLVAEQDKYTIVYIAEDACGNKTEKTIKVFGIDDASNPAVTFDYGTPLTSVDAGAINVLPKFTFDTRNNEQARKVVITATSDRETLVLAELNGSQEIEEFLTKDFEFAFNYSGEYTIAYAYSDNAISRVASYKVISNASNAISFPVKPLLPRYLIANATYDFEDAYAYSYVTGAQEPFAKADVYIAYDADVNEANVEQSTFTKLNSIYNNKITGTQKAVLKYEYQGVTTYTDVATIVDTNIDELAKLQQHAYFTGNFATGHPNDATYDATLFDPEVYYPVMSGKNYFDSSKLDYKSKVASGNNTLSFVNVIDISTFSFYYRIMDDLDSRIDADNFNALKLVLTDPYDLDNQVYIRIYKLDDGTTVYLDINGQLTSRVNQAFSGVENYVTYNRSMQIFKVTGVTAKLPFAFDFTTTKAYLDIVFEDISGVAGIRVVELNGHKFVHDGRARTAPTLLMTIPQGNYKSGSIVTIGAASFIDVLSPIVKSKVSLSVTDPSGTPLTALDGTVLDGTCDPYKSYQVKVIEMGQYKVSYVATSGINQKATPPGFIFVTDLVAPEITYGGNIYENCVLYLKPGQKYALQYTITDDVSLTENLFARIIWQNKFDSVTGIFFDNIIYFIKEGEYIVGVSCFDEQGNFARKTFTVIVTDEEVK